MSNTVRPVLLSSLCAEYRAFGLTGHGPEAHLPVCCPHLFTQQLSTEGSWCPGPLLGVRNVINEGALELALWEPMIWQRGGL